ncbi:pseudaminic acid synthase [Desulfobacca acetoxidans]|uniref:Pseudaminic acid synthase n=1 Tax=Desulfobacca acetoxidans (strain ATCC 700848 / DSM 11109 / ASRB2) TaxID=880072 RepID=F2NJR5_DESAR|nr:pseudaminic acid synthase [Desulfobacca acetoxidans]AEB09720.1 pseudaminic acid synthase [Desulfobacca acetoxidans DSM 11109]
MPSSIKINGRTIGQGQPVYLVAEMSANHHQDFEQAAAILQAAREAGADAVKLQTYTPETMTLNLPRADFQIGPGTIWAGRNLHDLYAEACTPWEWHPKLQKIAGNLGLDLFSSPFDASAVDFLEELKVPAYKIASFELVDLPLIRRVAKTGKPIVMSTGMATLGEIEEAVVAARQAGAEQIVLLKCTSAYPAAPEEMNLRTIPHLAAAFGVPVGLSDHSLGIAAPVAAVALGACLIEKHFTLSRSVPGPDSAFSLEPEEFRAMAQAVRTVEKALGRVSYGASPLEAQSRAFRRSLFVARDIKAGEVFTAAHVRSIRPGHGLAPKYLEQVLGRRAVRDIPAGTPVSWELLGN